MGRITFNFDEILDTKNFWKFLECRGEAGHRRAFADDNN